MTITAAAYLACALALRDCERLGILSRHFIQLGLGLGSSLAKYYIDR